VEIIDRKSPAVSRILIGVDGSDVAAAALSWAAGLAGPLDA